MRAEARKDDNKNALSLDSEIQALIHEAMALTKEQDAESVLHRALTELVERQRFLNWVAKHESSQRSGSA